MNVELNHIIAQRRLIQTLGAGGVGKTTLSVVLGIATARLGKKTLVITIDPSKRLMDTLHIKTVQDVSYVRELGIHAMMIDVAKSWEMILKRYASTSVYNKIVKNRFNAYLKEYFPGFDEYIASEVIYHTMNLEDYDTIVVDSPPSTYAISYLEASNRILDVLSNDFVISLIPYINMGSRPIRYIMKKEIFILKNIARFTGMEMLIELIKFINDLSPLLHGFRQRADFIKRFYTSNRCGFFIVTLPTDVSFYNTIILKDYLLQLRYNLDGIFINRLCLSCGDGEDCNIRNLPLDRAEGLINSVTDDKLREIIQRHFIRGIDARREILKKVEEFSDKYQNDLNLFEVPEMTGYIKSPQDILELYRGIKRLVKR